MKSLLILTFVAASLHAEDAPRLAAGSAAERFPVAAPNAAPVAVPAVQPGSYSGLLSRVTPAVVSVFPARLLEEGAADDPTARFFGKPKEETPESKDRERTMGLGSGVIITQDGWIVTNSHVAHLQSGKLADLFSVELHDRRRFPARLAGVDRATDIALLKIDTTGLAILPIADSDSVKTGDLVFAVGNPFKVGMTATMGMVSATKRTINLIGSGGYESFIQTDAAINPGNSGGALVDASGRLVGINTAIYGGTGGNVGIGFAVPTNLMRQIIIRLAEDGKVVRGFFGLQTTDVTSEKATTLKLPKVSGALVMEVMPGGPAATAGLKTDDVILSAGGQPVETRGDLRIALSLVKPGGTIAVEYARAGVTQSGTLAAVAEPTEADTGAFSLAALPGVKFRVGKTGLVVDSVAATAKKTHLEKGMELVEINGQPCATASVAETALRKGVNKIKVRNGDDEQTLAVVTE